MGLSKNPYSIYTRSKNIRLRCGQDHFPPLLGAGFDVHFERQTLIQKPVRVSRRGRNVDRNRISGGIQIMLNAKGPKQLCDRNEERSLRQVSPWANETDTRIPNGRALYGPLYSRRPMRAVSDR